MHTSLEKSLSSADPAAVFHLRVRMEPVQRWVVSYQLQPAGDAFEIAASGILEESSLDQAAFQWQGTSVSVRSYAEDREDVGARYEAHRIGWGSHKPTGLFVRLFLTADEAMRLMELLRNLENENGARDIVLTISNVKTHAPEEGSISHSDADTTFNIVHLAHHLL